MNIPRQEVLNILFDELNRSRGDEQETELLRAVISRVENVSIVANGDFADRFNALFKESKASIELTGGYYGERSDVEVVVGEERLSYNFNTDQLEHG